jgi:hypothetical protein
MTEVLYKVAARYKTLEVDLTSSYCPIGCCRDFAYGSRLICGIKAENPLSSACNINGKKSGHLRTCLLGWRAVCRSQTKVQN